jgi:flagellar biosynthesis activator protein FlaF
MNESNISNPYQQSSYDQIPQAGNPAYTEAWALVESARRMAGPIEYGSIDDPENKKNLRDALRLNWRLWTILQTELSLEDGPVPTTIRENMLNLCNFVDKHTVETLNDTTVERVSTLIEVNRQIANGLLASLESALDEATETESLSQNGDEHTPPESITSIDTDA